MTLYRKLLILVLSLTVLPMIVIGYFSYSTAEKSLKSEILKKLESIADLKVQKIEAFLKERSGDAFVVSQSDLLDEYFNQLEIFFNEKNNLRFQQARIKLNTFLKLYPEAYGYRDIMLVNPQGVIIYTSNLAHYQIEFQKRMSDHFQDLFEKCKKEIAYSDIYLENNVPGKFLMTVAAPVMNARGGFLGEIFFEIDMSVIYDLLNNKTGLGNTGETLIAKKTSEGALFLTPVFHDPDAALKRTVKFGSGLPIINAVEGKTGSGIAFDYNGDKVIAAWRPIPLTNWGMVAKMDISEAFHPIEVMQNRILLIFLFSISICIFLVLQITDAIATPISNLTQTTQKVMTGDLDARAEILSNDEVGKLAENFNSMVEKLTNANTSLNEAQKIAHLGSWEFNSLNNTLVWSIEMYKILEIDSETKPSLEILQAIAHPEDREFVKIIHEDSREQHLPFSIHYRLQLSGDKIKYIDEECITFFDDHGKPLRSVGTVHDMTPQKEAELEITKLNRELESRVAQRTAQLETANKELEAFSYSVSHDLRAPLRSITGFAELLKKNIYDSIDEKSRHYINVISESTIQMGQLIDDILSFSRMARTELMESVIDFSILVKNSVKTLDNEIRGRNIIWKINPMPSAKGDINLLQLVMNNLISNAVKFTQKQKEAEIEIGSKEDNNETIYYIKDNGAGFDMNYSNKLFGIFQRLHRQEEFPGTGVGLANVQRIIQRHGGRIWAKSSPGKGATFYFTLPENERSVQ
ncbi:MAG: cache domain-containing protein [Spirochaetia bacterium]|nr:cache domain-containing protein [Spirochaetia bacterium]